MVRGQVVGQSVNPTSAAQLSTADRANLAYCRTQHTSADCDAAVTIVSVPESIAHFTVPACYILYVYGSSCGHGLQGSGREVPAATYVGRYPPLYYAIVGLPSLAWHTSLTDYLMRLLSGLLTALMVGLALALSSVWSRSRLLVLAVAVAATPTVLIFGSAVNPSGLEMAASLCVWTGGLILVLDHAEHPPPSLVYGTAAAAIVLVLTRGLSPFWLALIAVSLLALAPRSLPVLVRCHAVRVAGADGGGRRSGGGRLRRLGAHPVGRSPGPPRPGLTVVDGRPRAGAGSDPNRWSPSSSAHSTPAKPSHHCLAIGLWAPGGVGTSRVRTRGQPPPARSRPYRVGRRLPDRSHRSSWCPRPTMSA